MSEETPSSRPPAILIVDDDRTVHLIIERALSDFPGEILHAYDGEEGLRIARERRPELVFTDALLPKLDGRELASRLKGDPEGARQTVVVMTALYRGTRYRNEAMQHFRADEFLEKPLTASRLRELAATIPTSPASPAQPDGFELVTS